jgi:hypothetical protein
MVPKGTGGSDIAVNCMPSFFVWTKMGVESGERLTQIVQRKESERIAGQGVFWWGIGNSLGSAVRTTASQQAGRLPVLFSRMLGRPKFSDVRPDAVWRWTGWEDHNGRTHPVPPHVNVISRGAASKGKHYALVCYAAEPISLGGMGRFDPNSCRTLSGKIPGASQVTALLDGTAGHSAGAYEIAFRATLIEPWAVKLVLPVPN